MISYNITQNLKQKILKSFQNQQYNNFQFHQIKSYQIKKIIQFIQTNCQRKSIIFFVRQQLKKNTLKGLNFAYNKFNIWSTSYVQNLQGIGISSCYLSVLKNLINKQFRYIHSIDPRQFADQKQIQKQNQQNNIQINLKSTKSKQTQNKQQFSILQIILNIQKLTIYNTLKIHPLQIYQTIPQFGFIDYMNFSIKQLQRIKQQQDYLDKLTIIQQQMMILSNQYIISPSLFKKNKNYMMSPKAHLKSKLNNQQLLNAIDYIGFRQLHHNHSIFQRQLKYFSSKYNFTQKQQQKLCVIIPSVNNLKNQRYMRIIDSINRQQYDEKLLQIIFIDDFSTDNTYQLTKNYVQKEYPNLNIKYLINKQKKYATFNIKTAAHQHCHIDSILVIVDGDDQLIGTQVFKLIDNIYKKQQCWIMYTNYITNTIIQGVSKQVPSAESQFFIQKQRKKLHFISALRTVKNKLYRKIKQQDHKDNKGNYFDSMYDDAMQYPLVQMAGKQKIIYVPQVLYLYNRFYGDNDDSNEKKILHRQQLYEQVLKRPKYQRVFNLN